MSADKTQNLLGSASGALPTTILGNGGPAPSVFAVTFFVNFNSGATICHGVPRRPSQFVDSQASLSVCLVQNFASHNSILGNAENCSCSIMMTNEDSLSHAACKKTDTVLSNFTKPNFLSELRYWLSPPSTSSPHFTRLSIFANRHLVHDLRCKTRKPTE